ncbi:MULTISPECIES: AfsR/SARP family transcriptional regulator [unclassified Streptomyces]|uniref:AfsR/SARP family transcriptional regulator n=1 Tax=unclassified Streptomyces TaxID=2593676 RepID=UPI002E34D39E|nr:MULTISPECIES: BTAD domain-containing putative transcriptional regulator [unclassified Streptomyces]
MRYGLRFGLLGPPVLYDADGEVRPIGSGKMRALLVALLLEPGRVVSVDALKDALWGGTPPASAQASLQNHVTRLRRLLDDPERLRAVPPGYVLRVGEGESDVRVFESHVTAARAAHAGRDGEGALREALAGLALWRGTPLGGVRSELGGHALVQRLEEARLLLLEWRYEAELWLAGTAAARAGSEAGAGSAGSGTTGDDGGGPGSSARSGGTPGGAEGAEGAAGVAGMRGSGTRKGLAKADGSGGSTGFAGADGSGGLLGTTGGIGPGCARLAALAPELAALVAEHPLREAFHRLLMLVLHRTGRQAEALAVHRDLRARLVEELGVEPGPAVREAHLEILRERDPGGFAGSPGARGSTRTGRADAADGSGRPGGPRGAGGRPAGRPGGGVGPAGSDGNQGNHGNHGHDGSRGNDGNDGPGGTDGPYGAGAVEQDGRTETDAAAGPTRTPSPRPAQLPPPPAHFTGRSDVRDELGLVLDTDRRLRLPVPAVAVISGMAGVGKSALALHVAHGLRERFPDGQLYINLHGATPGMTPLTPGQALAALLRDLGVEPRRVPELPDAAAALLRSTLAPTRTLMVLDDAVHAAQVRPLLPAGAGCAVIVTSRSPLTALDGAHRFPLAPLSDEDSAALLRAVSGRRDGLDSGHPLVELTGRLPLALRVVAARLAARHALTPDALAGQLTDTEGRLRHLEYDDLSVRRSLAVAHDALRASDREADRDAARALCSIGALDLPVYGAPLLARLSGIAEHRAEAALDRLVDVALLEETAYARYTPHDLVRDFAREIAGTTEATEATGTAGTTRTAGTPRASVATVTLVATGFSSGVSEAAAAPGPSGSSGSTAATDSAAPTDSTGSVGPAAPTESIGSVEPTGPAGPASPAGGPERTGRAADTSDAVVPNPCVSERALRWYAGVAARSLEVIVEAGLDRADRSRPTATQPAAHAADAAATPPFRSAKDAFAWGDLELENVMTLVERYAEVSAYVPVLVRLLNPYLQRSGRVAESEVLLRTALDAARRLGDEAAQAYALGDLAGLHFMTGRAGEALTLNDEALAIWRRLGVLSWVRRGLNNRGMLLEGLGRYEESSEALLMSLELSRELGDPHTEAITYSHLGNLYEHTDARAAIDHHRRSLAIGDAMDDMIIRHSAHCNIGYAHLTLGEPAAAVPHFEKSLRILGGHDDWHGESQTRLGLVRALRGVGHCERAARECELLLRRADRRADQFTGGLARHQRGLLLRTRGDVEGAHEQWRTALEALDGRDTSVVGELRELLRGA